MAKTVTKADIIEEIYEATDRKRLDIKSIVEKLLQIMKTALVEDGSLLISGFGKFESHMKSPRKGRNPHTDESIILAARRVAVFKVSRKLRAELNEE